MLLRLEPCSRLKAAGIALGLGGACVVVFLDDAAAGGGGGGGAGGRLSLGDEALGNLCFLVNINGLTACVRVRVRVCACGCACVRVHE